MKTWDFSRQEDQKTILTIMHQVLEEMRIQLFGLSVLDSTERIRGKNASLPACLTSQAMHRPHKLYRVRTGIPTRPLYQARLHGVRTRSRVMPLQDLAHRESSAIMNKLLCHPETPNVHIQIHSTCLLHPRQSPLRPRIDSVNGRKRKRKKERTYSPRRSRRNSRRGKRRTLLR